MHYACPWQPLEAMFNRRLCECFVVVTLLLILGSSPAYSQNLFFQPPTYAGGGQIISANLNGDGKPDLISLDGTVQLGNGDGTFSAGVPWTSGQNIIGTITSFAVADFNGDGKSDLAVSAGTFLYILLGNGDGTFQTAISSNIGTSLPFLLAADVNGDGKTDLLSIGFVFLGKGDGTFAAGNSFPVPNSTSVAALGDFNGDGKLDIVLTSGSSFTGNLPTPGSINILLGNGDGTFQSPVTSAGIVTPEAIATGDFNGDGKLDLALADSYTGQTSILLGNGNGTFQLPSSPLPASGTLAAADLNGDHKLDLVIQGVPLVEIFLGTGDGTFTLKDSYAEVSPQQPGSIAIADFNGDGKSDVASANVVLLGNGDGSFQGNVALTVPFGSAGVTGDFNNDGNPDVVLLSSNGNLSDLSILLGDGTGRFSLAQAYTLPSPGYAIATADLNGDGKLDIVAVTIDSTTGDWSLNILLGNGDGTFGVPTILPQGETQSQVPQLVIADLNGDHKPDVVVLNGQLSVFLGNGDGTFAAPVSYFAGESVNSFVVADFNNDGIPDFAAASAAGLGISLGRGDGTFQAATFTASSFNSLLATTDLNHDGNADLIAGGNLQVLLGNGDGTFTALPPTQLPPPVTPVYLADVNGDGNLDLVQLEQANNFSNTGVQALLGNGDGTFGNPTTILRTVPSCCLRGSLILLADFNRDNRPDIAVNLAFGNVGSGGITTVLNTAAPLAPGFVLSSSPLSPLAAGNVGTSTLTLTPIGGFTGSAGLSCTGLPTGANCTFAPPSVSASGTSTLTITTAPSTPPGNYPVQIAGRSGSLTRSVAIALVVITSTGGANASLSPAALTFAPQRMAIASSPQTSQLTNTGTNALTISAITIVGTNAGDFSQTNTCPSASALATGASCQIIVIFTPSGIGPRSAYLSLTDNATGSPQMVMLSGTGPDFSLSAGSTQLATVKPGATATYTIAAASTAEFNQVVTLHCSGAPALTVCTISPPSIQPNGQSSATVTITTTAPSTGEMVPFGTDALSINLRMQLFPFGLLGALLIVLLLTKMREAHPRLTTAIVFVCVAWIATSLTSCGGGGSSVNGGPPSSPGTAAGTYTITITGSSGTGSAATHMVTLTLVVQ